MEFDKKQGSVSVEVKTTSEKPYFTQTLVIYVPSTSLGSQRRETENNNNLYIID